MRNNKIKLKIKKVVLFWFFGSTCLHLCADLSLEGAGDQRGCHGGRGRSLSPLISRAVVVLCLPSPFPFFKAIGVCGNVLSCPGWLGGWVAERKEGRVGCCFCRMRRGAGWGQAAAGGRMFSSSDWTAGMERTARPTPPPAR